MSSFKLSKPTVNQSNNPVPQTAPDPTTHPSNPAAAAQMAGQGQAGTSNNAACAIETIDVRQAAVCLLEDDLSLKSAVAERTSFMVNVGEILNRMASPEDMGKRMSQGLTICCWIDTATGTLGFEMNNRETGIRYQVEAGAQLFPAVFIRPTARETVQFEFGRRNRFSLPITSGMLRPPRQILSSLPKRLKIQVLEKVHWARLSPIQPKAHSMKMSDARGWSVLLEDPVSQIMLKMPEAERSVILSELDEEPALLKFHANTLTLYKAICCHGNHNIRSGMVDLLITMHLASHVKLAKVTSKEFIVPLSKSEVETPNPTGRSMDKAFEMEPDHIPAISNFCSIRPILKLDPHLLIPGADGTGNIAAPEFGPNDSEEHQLAVSKELAGANGLIKLEKCPPFPLEDLKITVIKMLVQSVNSGGLCRDPVGGSFEHMLLPTLKILNDLLVMGVMNDQDLEIIMMILDPKVFQMHRNMWNHLARVEGSLFELPLPESVKAEVCTLFHNLCDFQLRYRVEKVISFANTYVNDVQNDQESRYVAIKQAILPSSLAAKLTREFRCPPDEQMRILLRMPGYGGPTLLWPSMEIADSATDADAEAGGEVAESAEANKASEEQDEEEEVNENPCADEVKDILRAFHRRLTDHFKVVRPDDYNPDDDPYSRYSDPEYAFSLVYGKDSGYVSAGTASVSQELMQWQQQNQDSSKTLGQETLTEEAINEILKRIDELASLPKLPEHIGNFEEGSGGPPRILKAAWNLVKGAQKDPIKGKNSSKNTDTNVSNLEEMAKTRELTNSE
ncbi:Ryanodine receptor 3 [Cichlidogyrus casuarinus]|uniref:Ryanodine receptor 3 n=1 Tax=Cichlidogyrus casuarinus TaxID=1844966 RepID=A0ABD2QMB9_9PLAT